MASVVLTPSLMGNEVDVPLSRARTQSSSTTIVQDDSLSRAWRQLEQQLRELSMLTDDWDGEGSRAIEASSIRASLELLKALDNQLPPPSRVLPTQSRGVLIEWQMEGIYLEAEVTPHRIVEWMQFMPGNQPMHWESTLPSGVSQSTVTEDLHDESTLGLESISVE